MDYWKCCSSVQDVLYSGTPPPLYAPTPTHIHICKGQQDQSQTLNGEQTKRTTFRVHNYVYIICKKFYFPAQSLHFLTFLTAERERRPNGGSFHSLTVHSKVGWSMKRPRPNKRGVFLCYRDNVFHSHCYCLKICTKQQLQLSLRLGLYHYFCVPSLRKKKRLIQCQS